jgi:hypothetical protein
MTLLGEIYNVANKYRFEACKNHIVDHFYDLHNGRNARIVYPAVIFIVSWAGDGRDEVVISPLRDYLICRFAENLLYVANWKTVDDCRKVIGRKTTS